MTEFNKYASIGQYRNALKCMQYHGITEILYEGSVKLHGTNAAINYNGGSIITQSRNRIISVDDDNSQFAVFVDGLQDDTLMNTIPEEYQLEKNIVVYGEWCGEGIMKGVGVNKLPRMFVIFDVKIDDQYISSADVAQFGKGMQAYNIYNIYSFPTFMQTIEVSLPAKAQQRFATLTQQVEDECPVAVALGVEAVDGKPLTGEGIVWKPVDIKYRQISDLCFKTKGDKHSASKVRTIAEITPEMLAKEKAVDEFVNITVTENRLMQGIDYLKEMGIPLENRSTGKFLKWVGMDVYKEEIDTIKVNGLERKDFGGTLNKKAKTWWFNYLNDQVGL